MAESKSWQDEGWTLSFKSSLQSFSANALLSFWVRWRFIPNQFISVTGLVCSLEGVSSVYLLACDGVPQWRCNTSLPADIQRVESWEGKGWKESQLESHKTQHESSPRKRKNKESNQVVWARRDGPMDKGRRGFTQSSWEASSGPGALEVRIFFSLGFPGGTAAS